MAYVKEGEGTVSNVDDRSSKREIALWGVAQLQLRGNQTENASWASLYDFQNNPEIDIWMAKL